MAARSIATLSLSFGLVSIPVKLYSAIESSSALRFKLMASTGARVRQQYVADSPPPPGSEPKSHDSDPALERRPDPRARSAAGRVIDFPAPRPEPAPPPSEQSSPDIPVVERSEMVKGYEFENGKFVLFTADELEALAEGSRQSIDIVSFIPQHAVDPLYYDKAYLLAPDERGAKPYSLLARAMRDTSRCALAKWAFRAKEYVVEIRPAEGGLVLQQLLYADEVRSLADLEIELVDVSDAELKLAGQLIDQISAERYDPTQFVDAEKQRILAAVERKIAGKKIVAPNPVQHGTGAHVVDLIEALRASLQPGRDSVSSRKKGTAPVRAPGARKPIRRARTKTVDGVSQGKRR